MGLSLHPRSSEFDWLYSWFRLHGSKYLPRSSHQSWTMFCLPVLLTENKQMTTTKSKQNKSQSYSFFLNRLTVWCQSSFKSEVTGTTSMRTSFLLLFLKIKGKHRSFTIKPKQMSHQGQSPTAHHQSGTSPGCRCKRNQPMWFICSRCHQAVVWAVLETVAAQSLKGVQFLAHPKWLVSTL